MAKSPNSKSKPHLLLCCFGFSGKFRRFKPLKPTATHKKRPFSWMKFHSKPPPPLRYTFPMDSDRLSSKSNAPTATYKLSNEDSAVMVPVAANRAGEEMNGPEVVKNDVVEEKIIIKSCERLNSPKKPADQSQSRFSLTRKLESFRSSRFVQPSPLTTKKNSKSISHSLSFSPSNLACMSQVSEPLTTIRVGSTNSDGIKTNQPVTGISILIITLAIMVLWGKLCAIFCTATWIFFITSLRSIFDEDDEIDFIESDSYSEGFKKKLVVLKGFLCRNQRDNLLKKL